MEKCKNAALIEKMKKALQESNVELKQTLDEIGFCDHSVGFCVCGLISLIESNEELLAEVENND